MDAVFVEMSHLLLVTSQEKESGALLFVSERFVVRELGW